MRLIIFALCAGLAACSPPAETTAPPPSVAAAPAAGQLVEFQAPSGNIGCTYVPAGGTAVYQPAEAGAELSCDRVAPTYVRIGMSEHGAAHVIETDERGCCSGESIPFGSRWSEGPFACDVTEAGVACTSSDGHGFSLSRTETQTH